MQTKITKLPPDIVAKIAAGEVIERPAYVVKELVENALDAKATKIAIHIEEAGLRHIMVVDDGIGMSRDDLLESFKLYTTSKLSTIDELTTVASLGFRGEALASIASISNLLIRSRTRHATSGNQIEIRNGKFIEIVPVGMPKGTTVSASQLFNSVPARKKFLKSQQTEFRHILDVVSRIALSHPEVAFSLTHNKKIILDLPATKEQRDRLQAVFGTGLSSNLLPVSYQDPYITITGFIGAPQTATVGTPKQFLFVNGRSITDKWIASVIKNVYGTLIMAKSQPVFALSFALPYEHVDVNVHPRKEQVRFADSQVLINACIKAINQTFAKQNISFYDEKSFGIALGDADVTKSYTGRILKENTVPWDIRVRDEIIGEKEILQIHSLYLLTQSTFGMVLIDQHAAHERILYEQFMDEFRSRQQETAQFHLPKPVLIDLSFSDTALLQGHLSLFSHIGFTVEHFRDNAFVISAVPLLFQDRDIAKLVSELLVDLLEEKQPKAVDQVSQRIIAFLACRGAIKAGESLTKKQARDLVQKLEKTNHNATCPHGRPTKIMIDIDQLHKMFKRK